MATTAAAGLRNANPAAKAKSAKTDAPKRDGYKGNKPMNGKPAAKKEEKKEEAPQGPVIREYTYRASPIQGGMSWANALKKTDDTPAPAPKAAPVAVVEEKKEEEEEEKVADDWEAMANTEAQPAAPTPVVEKEKEKEKPVTKKEKKAAKAKKLTAYEAQAEAVIVEETSEYYEDHERTREEKVAARDEYQKQSESAIFSFPTPKNSGIVFRAEAPRVAEAVPAPIREAEPTPVSWVDDMESPMTTDAAPAVTLPTPPQPRVSAPTQMPAPAAASAAPMPSASQDDPAFLDRSNWGAVEGQPAGVSNAPAPLPMAVPANPSAASWGTGYTRSPFGAQASKGKREHPFGAMGQQPQQQQPPQTAARTNGGAPFGGKKGGAPPQNGARVNRGQFQSQTATTPAPAQSQPAQPAQAPAHQAPAQAMPAPQAAKGGMHQYGGFPQGGFPMQGSGYGYGYGAPAAGGAQWGRQSQNYYGAYATGQYGYGYPSYPQYGMGYPSYGGEDYYRSANYLPQSQYTGYQGQQSTSAPAGGAKGRGN